MTALASVASVDCIFFGTTTPDMEAAFEAWNEAPGFSVSLAPMEVGSLADLNGKPGMVGFVLGESHSTHARDVTNLTVPAAFSSSVRVPLAFVCGL